MKTKITAIIMFSFLCLTNYAQGINQFDKGVGLFNDEDYSKALTAFKKYQKKNDGLTVKFYIASCYFKMEDFNISKDRFIEIINLYKDVEEIGWSMVNLGTCYRELNQIDSATYHYKKAGELYPLCGSFFNLAQLYYSLDEFAKAKEQYNIALKYDSTNALYYIKRQEINFILNDYKSALEDMLLAREYDSKFYSAINEAFCHSMMENYARADSVFMLVFNDKDPLFLNNFGFNKHKMGNTEEGLNLIQKSLKISPNNSYAYRNLAMIYIDQNDTVSACEHLLKAKELKFYTNYGNEVNELIIKFCH
jgi:tetratricopeptide (TPR) repeat protein